MFERNKPRFVSNQVAKSLPVAVLQFLWDIIDEAGKTDPLDYLQVIELKAAHGESCVVKITHWQEMSPFTKEYGLFTDYELNLNHTVLYAVDEKTHQTLFFAEEY